METFFSITAFAFGSIVGSFLNVCIYRLPRNLSIVFPASFCPACKKPVPPHYNIPLLGYFLLGGKCGFCGAKISFRYPLVEFLTAVAAVLSYIAWPLHIAGFYFAFIASLIVITFIDMEFQIIPDVISLPGIPIGFIFSVFILQKSWALTLFAILLGGGMFYLIGKIYELAAKREGLGGGDVKLMAMFGAFLGIKAIPFITLIASLTGTLVGVYLMAMKKKSSTFAIPFGPFLCLAALIYVFWGDVIINWYLGKL